MALIGYARVSTLEQSTQAQVSDLKAAGCTKIFEESASGGDRSRPVLQSLIGKIGAGDTLVVVRIDRLARSLSHLLEVIETLQKKGAAFRSLGDPIDTSSPQGKFTLQILGATAEFERALIQERTKAGLQAARSKGRIGGNPGLRSGDVEALRKIRHGRRDGYIERLSRTADQWVPDVRRHRPDMPWEDLVRVINARLPKTQKPWTEDRLKRAARAYVAEGFLDGKILERAPKKPGDDRLLTIVAGIAGSKPDITLREIAQRLTALRERTPRGRSSWSLSSVKMLLDRARSHGFLPPEDRTE